MRTRWVWLVVAVGCSAPVTTDLAPLDSEMNGPASRSGSGSSPDAGATPSKGSSVVVTNSPAGKAFYDANVHPALTQKCGACHSAAGPGPGWFTPADSGASYKQLFAGGYVIQNSPIVAKGPHALVETNVLSAAEVQRFGTWVAMELRDGGQKAPPNVLTKLGECFDRQKFDAMELDAWRTKRRPNEAANPCTGCNNAPCSTCHSADPATKYVNAVGNSILPDDYTFEESKTATYIVKYFGVSPEGKPVASNAIKLKSDSTAKDRPYSHPLYTLTVGQSAALDAFVADVIAKYNAGTCGK